MKLYFRVILLAACAIWHLEASELEESSSLSETTLTESQCTATVKKVQASGKFTEDAIGQICSSEVKSSKCDFFAEALSLASTHNDFTSKAFCKDISEAHACSQMMDNLYQSTATKDLLFGECMRAAETKSEAYCMKFKSLLSRSVRESDLDTMRACYMVQAYDQKDGELASPAKTETKKDGELASPAKTETKKESKVASSAEKKATTKVTANEEVASPAKTETKKESKVASRAEAKATMKHEQMASPAKTEAKKQAKATAHKEMASPAKAEAKKEAKEAKATAHKEMARPSKTEAKKESKVVSGKTEAAANATSQLAKAQVVSARGSPVKTTAKATAKATAKITTAASTHATTKAATKKETNTSQAKAAKVAHMLNTSKVVALAKRNAKLSPKDKKAEDEKKYGGFLSGFVL